MPRGVRVLAEIQVGERYGSRAVVREEARALHGHRRWLVRCDCGNESVTDTRSLRLSKTCLRCRLTVVHHGSRRSGRAGARAQTTTAKEMRALVLEDRRDPLLGPDYNVDRPQVRGDCEGGERPCPYAACKYHLAYDVSPAGMLKANFPGVEIEDMAETCALDVADDGPQRLETIGQLMNLTRERVRQLEGKASFRLRRTLKDIYDAEEAEGKPQ